MKKFFIMLMVVAMTITMLGIQPAHLVYAQSPSFTSSIQVLNLSGTTANLSIYYYNPDGSLASMAINTATGLPYPNPVPDTVLGNSSNTYYPTHVAAGFSGSVVIASDQKVAVIGNIIISTTAASIGSYVAFDQGSPTIYFPVVMKGNNFQSTMLTIQNTGLDQASITIDFIKEPGSAYPDVADITDTIATGAAKSYDLNSISQFTSVTKWVGSVKVYVTDTANDTIAGVSNTINRKISDAWLLATYNAFTNGSTSAVLPLIQENNSGNRTSINCQNLDPTTTTRIDVEYIPEAGGNAKTAEYKENIVSNGTAVFLQDYVGAVKFVGSAKVTSTPAVNLACVVVLQKPATGRYGAYEGFDPGKATNSVVLPEIQSRNGNATNGYVYTTINAAVANSTSQTVTCDFLPNAGFADAADASKTGAQVVFVQDNLYGTGAKYIGGARCSVPTGGLFVVVVKTRNPVPQAFRDVLALYDGFNQ